MSNPKILGISTVFGNGLRLALSKYLNNKTVYEQKFIDRKTYFHRIWTQQCILTFGDQNNCLLLPSIIAFEQI